MKYQTKLPPIFLDFVGPKLLLVQLVLTLQTFLDDPLLVAQMRKLEKMARTASMSVLGLGFFLKKPLADSPTSLRIGLREIAHGRDLIFMYLNDISFSSGVSTPTKHFPSIMITNHFCGDFDQTSFSFKWKLNILGYLET